LGLGPSAHSLIGNKRFWNVYNFEKYIQLLGQNRLPIEDEELLSPEDRKLERLALGLRTKEGIFLSELDLDEGKVSILVKNGLAVLRGGRLALTAKGMLLADEIAVGLV
ncbi:MAG TPA: coproporphyrinogen III oxidase family protein, partial [bacterium]